MSDTTRDKTYDVLKGIAIITMVALHARAPYLARHFCGLFHMPVFFILAGWFFNFNHASNAVNCIRYTKKRFSRLWWPMFFWGLIFILLHNVLLNWHLISTLPMEDTPMPPSYRPHFWTTSDFIQNILGAPFAQGNYSQLAGAFWFLHTLLLASIGYCLSSFLFKLTRIDAIILQTILSTVLIYAGRHYQIPLVGCIGGPRTFTAYALIHLGVLLRHFDLRIERLGKRGTLITTTGCFICLTILSAFGGIALSCNKFNSCAFLFACSVCGWYFLLGTSSFVSGPIQRTLAYIGAHTMPILLLHFLAFKLVSFIGVLTHHGPMNSIAEHPITHFGPHWWIPYTIAGVGLPLLANHVYAKAASTIGHQIHTRAGTQKDS